MLNSPPPPTANSPFHDKKKTQTNKKNDNVSFGSFWKCLMTKLKVNQKDSKLLSFDALWLTT